VFSLELDRPSLPAPELLVDECVLLPPLAELEPPLEAPPFPPEPVALEELPLAGPPPLPPEDGDVSSEQAGRAIAKANA
jgi:hypothetical protein